MLFSNECDDIQNFKNEKYDEIMFIHSGTEFIAGIKKLFQTFFVDDNGEDEEIMERCRNLVKSGELYCTF
jgi:hypothetical protein